MVEYIVENTKVDVNIRNHKGCTALDLIPENASDAEALSIRFMLLRAGAERSKGVQCLQPGNAALQSNISGIPHPSSYCSQEEVAANYSDMGSGNVCETAMLIAALLAMAAFSASMRPPGGVYKEGELIGTAIMANNGFFKLFTLTNDLALWTSVSTVIGLAAVASLSQESTVMHLPKIYWSLYISVSLTSLSYISSRFIMVPPSTGHVNWLMLPIYIISPAAHVLFFFRLRKRDKIEEEDEGTDLPQTASMIMMEERPESNENNTTGTASESFSGASYVIKDISGTDRPTEIGLTHRKSVHSHG